ncbi:MAG: hypothetical protein Q3962_01755 [Corynebacterium sp.]|nr:hypothetical protein [Corynebacterium sp.]
MNNRGVNPQLSRRRFLQAAGALGLVGLGASTLSACGAGKQNPDSTATAKGASITATAATATSATAITRVFGDGLRVTGVALEYQQDLAAQIISSERFSIADRTVTKVYTNSSPAEASTPTNGKYIIIELAEDDAASKVIATAPDGQKFAQPILVTVNDSTDNSSINTTKRANTTIDDFAQLNYVDTATNLTITHSLYTPQAAKAGTKLPLVIFLADASCLSADPSIVLSQGLGAVSFAEETNQKSHPCYVLAPHFAQVIADDSYQITDSIRALLGLIDNLIANSNIDTSQIYLTGQAMGGMGCIALNLARPNFFAASYMVSTHWDANALEPIATTPLWFTASAGDPLSADSINAIGSFISAHGGTSATVTSNHDSYKEDLQNLAGQKATTSAFFFAANTLPSLSEAGVTEHTAAWITGYDLPVFRDWLFSQKLTTSGTTTATSSTEISTANTQ